MYLDDESLYSFFGQGPFLKRPANIKDSITDEDWQRETDIFVAEGGWVSSLWFPWIQPLLKVTGQCSSCAGLYRLVSLEPLRLLQRYMLQPFFPLLFRKHFMFWEKPKRIQQLSECYPDWGGKAGDGKKGVHKSSWRSRGLSLSYQMSLILKN